MGSGGARVLSREEEAEARAEAEAEFEKEESEFRKGKGKRNKRNEKKKSVNDADDELGSLFGEGVTGRLPRFANRITPKVSGGFAALLVFSYLSINNGGISLHFFEKKSIVLLFYSQNISPKMKLWGVIVEVNQKDLVVGLPGGLRGYVRGVDVSDIVLDEANKVT